MKKKTVHVITLLAIGTMLSAASWPNNPTSTAEGVPFGDRYWVLTSTTIHPALDVDMDGEPDTDLTILQEPCERDDASKYRSDGVILTDHGSVRCDEEEEREEETGTWSYDASTKTVTMDHYDSDKPVIATVSSASSTKIVLTSRHESAHGTHTITAVMTPRN